MPSFLTLRLSTELEDDPCYVDTSFCTHSTARVVERNNSPNEVSLWKTRHTKSKTDVLLLAANTRLGLMFMILTLIHGVSRAHIYPDLFSSLSVV
jgi:hypothetical protein